MTYTAKNIEQIKRDGKFDAYVEMERALINKIEGSELVDDGKTITFAHFYGEYGVVVDGRLFSGFAQSGVVGINKEWGNFQSENAARQYARAALRNCILETAADILGKAKERLAQLEAAR